MNRQEMEQMFKTRWEVLKGQITGNPLKACAFALAGGFIIGVFREFFIPILLIVALLVGVLWLIGEKSAAE